MISIFKYTPTRKVSQIPVVEAKTVTMTGVQRIAMKDTHPADKLRVSIGDPARPTHFMLIDRKMVEAMYDAFKEGK